jgi:hypothetical protein
VVLISQTEWRGYWGALGDTSLRGCLSVNFQSHLEMFGRSAGIACPKKVAHDIKIITKVYFPVDKVCSSLLLPNEIPVLHLIPFSF